MKLNNCFIILLFVFIASLVSCNNVQDLYDKGSYQRALDKLDAKKNLSKDDYLIKVKSLYKLNRQSEAKESLMLYLLMASDNNIDRPFLIKLFLDIGYTDALNILLLKPEDGFKAQLALFTSYYNLKQYDKALDILSKHISEKLTISEYLALLIKYPINDQYTLNFFDAWLDILNIDEVYSYLQFFREFIESDKSDEILKKAFDFTDKILESEYIKDDPECMALVYKYKGMICEKLFDYYNAKQFYSYSVKLYPFDYEVQKKLK